MEKLLKFLIMEIVKEILLMLRILVEGVVRDNAGGTRKKKNGEDGLPIPPYAVYNIGNNHPENLLDFVQFFRKN